MQEKRSKLVSEVESPLKQVTLEADLIQFNYIKNKIPWIIAFSEKVGFHGNEFHTGDTWMG